MTQKTPKKVNKKSESEVKKNKLPIEQTIKPFDLSTLKIKLKFKNKKQKELYDTILENRITIIRGAAGTGKTLISLMAALECLKDEKYNINKIVLTTPIIEAANSIGFLPGSLIEKVDVYFNSFINNFHKLIGEGITKHLMADTKIEKQILNFMRGDTFGTYDKDNKPQGWIVIGDEMQNSTIKEMKLFISRLGENTKIIIMGDTDQIDLKLKQGEISGLQDAFERFKDLNGVGFVEFTEDDIVREPFLIEIMKRYKK